MKNFHQKGVLLIILLPVYTCKTLFLSMMGSDINTCLNQNDTCHNVTRVIELSQAGDVIYLIAEGTENSPMEICTELPIKHDLTIEGTKGVPNIRCSADVRTVFRIQGGTVKIKNLRLISGIIQTNDASLIVQKCTFEEDAGIFGMTIPATIKHKNESSIHSLIFILETVRQAFPGEHDDACYNTNIQIIQCQWNQKTIVYPVYLDLMMQEGVQVICKRINITVDNTYVADRRIYIAALTELHLGIYDSEFEGKAGGAKYMGGLLIETFPSLPNPDVTVENCIFKNLQFKDMAHEVAWNYLYAAAAVTIKVFPTDFFEINSYLPYTLQTYYDMFNSEVVQTEIVWYGIESNNRTHLNEEEMLIDYFQNTNNSYNEYNFIISNTTFKNNTRSFSVVYDPKMYRPSLLLYQNEFLDNRAVTDGGAVYISGLSKVEIFECDFARNSAGANVQPPIIATNTNLSLAKSFHFIVLEYSIIGDRFQVKYEMEDSSFISGYEVNVGSRELSGEGGAIHVDNSYCEISDTTFRDNFAYKYGGTIYGTRSAHVAMDNCFVNNTENHESMDGTVLKTYGTLIMINISITVGHARDNFASTINHFTDLDQATVWVSNITLRCPKNSRLQIFNVSGDMFSDEDETENSLGYKKLKYTCSPCSSGNYSLRSGYVFVPVVATITTKEGNEIILDPDTLLKKVKYTEVTCDKCPYGGTCQESIVSKPNYWGAPTEDLSALEFHRCPPSYCCSSTKCDSYNQCTKNRHGRLCSRCIRGYTEALFSAKCIKESDCNDQWIIVLVVFLAFAYSTFLLFQKNVKDFIFGAPIGRNIFSKRTMQTKLKSIGEKTKETMDHSKGETNDLSWDAQATKAEKDEGGMFLILLFYYFQDASIVRISTIYVSSESAFVSSLKEVIGGVFKFRLDLLHLAKTVCGVSGLTPSAKIMFKLSFVLLVLGILVVTYVLSLYLVKKNLQSKIWDFLARRAALAIVFAVLFSYQKLATSLFKLVNCVEINGKSVMFIDGEMDCYTTSQIIVLLVLVLCICPFSFYIALSPALMKHGYISLAEFYTGCLIPLPMITFWVIKYYLKKNKKVKPNDDAVSVYKLLQGPYREFDLPGILRYTCWSGVLLGRRLCLILAATFISNVVIRLSIMMAVCQIALLHHVLVKPCKEKRGNVAGTISSSALLIVCTVNFLRAAYESAEYEPEGPNYTLMQVFDQVENSLLVWIPLAGIVIILVVFVCRIFARFTNNKTKQRNQRVAPTKMVKSQDTGDIIHSQSFAQETKKSSPDLKDTK